MRAASRAREEVVRGYLEMEMIWGEKYGLKLGLRKTTPPMGGVRCVPRAGTVPQVDILKSSQRCGE